MISDCPAAPAALRSLATHQQCGIPAAETNAQGIASPCAVRPSCPTPTGRLLVEGSCSIWGRSTEVRRCSQDSVGQMRWLNRQARVACGTTRWQRCRQCNSCGFDTPLREHRSGDTFHDRRQPRHQDAAAGGTAGGQQLTQELAASTSRRTFGGQPASELPYVWDIVLTGPRQEAAPRASPGIGDGTPAVRGLSTRHGLGRKSRRSHERSPVLGFALPLPLSRCLLKSRKVSTTTPS